ncbi:hypothetical protein BaRGS_00017106 [Batillaria attramentaria]|uniref:SOCS box domain-containing protein n=1 Tax=Batillaria attramentaria TaxID=370345 RepID=A0ABD0KWW7_9CAEN
MDHVIDPSASKEVVMSSLDWCTRSRQVSLLQAVLTAHFSTDAISDLERECSHVLRNAVISGCQDTLTSLLRHVDQPFLLQRHDAVLSADVKDGRTRVDKLLGIAVEHGHRSVAEVLLSRGGNPNCTYRGKPILHLALSQGHVDVTNTLLDHGVDIHQTDTKGETAIFAALSSDFDKAAEVVDRLISVGADVNHRSMTGRQPIHIAALSSNTASLKRLIETGCDVSSRDGVMSDTPLHLACSRCCQDTIVTLVQHGADCNSVNRNGDTPLRKLLQHATRASRDFHCNTRISMARTLVTIGFRLAPSSKHDSEVVGRDEQNPNSSHARKPSDHHSPQNNSHSGYSNTLLSASSRRPSCRDKVAGIVQTLTADRKSGVPALQHYCRLEIRTHLPSVSFQHAVGQLDLAPHLKHYIMFRPQLLDDTV